MTQQNQNKGPKVGIHLRAVPVLGENNVSLTAKVVKGEQGKSGVDVQFYRDGQLIPGACGRTSAGEFTHKMDIPKGVTSIRFKATAAINGLTSEEVTMAVPPNVFGSGTKEGTPGLVVEDNTLGPRIHRHSICLFDKKGKMVPGEIQISTSKPIRIVYPDRADEGNPDLHIGVNPSTYHRIKIRGDRWETYDIRYDEEFEMDIFVAGHNRMLPDLKFKIGDSMTAAKGISWINVVVATLAFFLAWFATFIGIFGWWVFALPIALVVTGVLAAFAGVDVALYNGRVTENPEAKPNPGIFASLVLTNNRVWAICILPVFLYCLFLFVFFTSAGSPVLVQDSRDALTAEQKAQEYKPGYQGQRWRNQQANLGFKNDDQLRTPKPEVSWEPWYVRLVILFASFILLIVGGFWALSDEAKAAALSVFVRGKGKTEGVAVAEKQGLLARLSDKVLGKQESPDGDTNTPPPLSPSEPGGPPQTPNQLLRSIGWTVIGAFASQALESVIESWRKDKGGRRRRYETD